MPNHVKNKISLNIARLMRSEERDVDFNAVIKMPESLINPDPQQMESRAFSALGLHKDLMSKEISITSITNNMRIKNSFELMFKPLNTADIPLLIQAINNIKDHGFAYWYPWACEKWGTKWNAYEVEIKDGFCTFETAWSHPEPVFIKLSELNPDIEINVAYADEDIGRNAEERTYKGGEIIQRRELTFIECFNLVRPGEILEDSGYDEFGNYDESRDLTF